MLIVSCENCLVLEHVYFIFQPWAFPAREFLRKKLIGKEVCFTIENKTPQGREYGMIYLGKGEYRGGKVHFSPSLRFLQRLVFVWRRSLWEGWLQVSLEVHRARGTQVPWYSCSQFTPVPAFLAWFRCACKRRIIFPCIQAVSLWNSLALCFQVRC